MKQLYIAIISCFIFSIANGQRTIKLEDVNKHVGDSVKVCGKVYGIKYLQQAKNSPTFLNLGAAFPNQQLTIVIWENTRKKMTKSPEEMFSDKNICVSGKVELFKDKPQIVLRDVAEITIE